MQHHQRPRRSRQIRSRRRRQLERMVKRGEPRLSALTQFHRSGGKLNNDELRWLVQQTAAEFRGRVMPISRARSLLFLVAKASAAGVQLLPFQQAFIDDLSSTAEGHHG